MGIRVIDPFFGGINPPKSQSLPMTSDHFPLFPIIFPRFPPINPHPSSAASPVRDLSRAFALHHSPAGSSSADPADHLTLGDLGRFFDPISLDFLWVKPMVKLRKTI